MRKIKLDINDIKNRYAAGEAVSSMAKNLSVSRTVIVRRLKELGLSIRSGSDANKLRMSRLSVSEKLALTSAAHDAVRGVSQSEEHRRKIAHCIESKGLFDSICEEKFSDMLGVPCTPQKAIGRYNVDIALDEFPIAVEIFGGHWHTTGHHARRFRKRFDFIINSGWIPVIIWVTKDYPVGIEAAKYVISLAEALSAGKPVGRQEHVIRGDGNVTAVGKSNLDYRATVGGDKCGDLIRGKDGRFTNETIWM